MCRKLEIYLFQFIFILQMLEEKLEYWMEKYDKDVEAKQHELDVLKVNKQTLISPYYQLAIYSLLANSRSSLARNILFC